MLQDRGAMMMGLAVGAGLMYLLDPAGGRRRRARMRDQVLHATNLTGRAAAATGRDIAHRASGIASRVRGTLRPEPVDDRVLLERVRAQLGRVVSHPRALEVSANNGTITLRGPILQHEEARLCRAVERIRGVRQVVNELEKYREAGNVPALQGGSAPRGIWQRAWSPTARAITAVAATAGAGVLARAVTSQNGRFPRQPRLERDQPYAGHA